MNCEQARQEAAVALLTRRPPETVAAEHIDDCFDCRQHWQKLSPLPSLLAVVRDQPVGHPEPAGELLLNRLLATARRRRRHRMWLSVAAVSLLVLAVPLGVVTGLRHTSPPTAAAGAAATESAVTSAPASTYQARDAATGIWGHIELRGASWGSDLTFGVGGVPPGTLCSLSVFTQDGRRESAGSWRATAEHYTQVHGSVAAQPEQIQRIEIVDQATGHVLLQVEV